MSIVYLDHAATTPTDRRVLEAMLPYFADLYGNPSSLYQSARRARAAVEEARETVAAFLKARPEEIVFTSGGTEADNLAIKGIALANQDRGRHLITSSIEHHAVLESCRWLEGAGFRVTYLNVDRSGRIDLDQLKKALSPETILVSVMHANNEVGTVQPLAEIASVVSAHGAFFHTDAVQTAGKLPLDVDELGVDLLALSGHKFYGPKGVGALYVRKGTSLEPRMHGGHHEHNRRAGTENVPGIVGLAAACARARDAMEQEERHCRELADRLRQGLRERIDDIVFTGHPTERLPGLVSVCVKYVEGESMLMQLDLAGICASSGSACTSGSLEPSHVLSALGIAPEVSHGSLRFSLGKETALADISRVCEVLPPIVERLRAISPLRSDDQGGRGQ